MPGTSQQFTAAADSGTAQLAETLSKGAKALLDLEKTRAEILGDMLFSDAGTVSASGSSSGKKSLSAAKNRRETAAKELKNRALVEAQMLGALEKAERELRRWNEQLAGLEARPAPVESLAHKASALSIAKPATGPAELTAPVEIDKSLSDAVSRLEIQWGKAKESVKSAKNQKENAEKNLKNVLQEMKEADGRPKYAKMASDYYKIRNTDNLQALKLSPFGIDSPVGVNDYEVYRDALTEQDDRGELRIKPDLPDAPDIILDVISLLSNMSFPGRLVSEYGPLLGSLLPEEGSDGFRCLVEFSHQASSEWKENEYQRIDEAVGDGLRKRYEDEMHLTEAVVRNEETLRGSSRKSMKVIKRDVGISERVRQRDVQTATRRSFEIQHLVGRHFDELKVAIIRGFGDVCRGMRPYVSHLKNQESEAKENVASSVRMLRQAVMEQLNLAKELEAAREKLARAKQQRFESLPLAGQAPTEAAIPVTVEAAGPDIEARKLKLRGQIEETKAVVKSAQNNFNAAKTAHATAKSAMRLAEQHCDAQVAEFERQRDAGLRATRAIRSQGAEQRRKLKETDDAIDKARQCFESEVRKSVIQPMALDRLVQRHVEHDDESLKARAQYTGRAAAYGSPGNLAAALADINHAARQQFPDLFNAKTAQEFSQVAAGIEGGVIDRVHEHGRKVGRGFSNAPDQPTSATDVTQSCYTLAWDNGKVVVSHLYPYIPPRQLRVQDDTNAQTGGV